MRQVPPGLLTRDVASPQIRRVYSYHFVSLIHVSEGNYLRAWVPFFTVSFSKIDSRVGEER